ncbi:Hypothetical protein SRAE_2000526300 [Strongyloides ratti]|uniref:Uncharacterized protein n=1 Tax=Strongyloides ratti TaxID=34506 RepID=A0A090N0G3_STRRB|nr:Hypothetical protein SRAE_2000526300 [Strongyloides ratti]CEF70638.1 Hypothetical protein SRAE_2000526300 [Strongyloides ratti]
MKFLLSANALLILILGFTFSYALNVKQISTDESTEFFSKRMALTDSEKKQLEELNKFVTFIPSEESTSLEEQDNKIKSRKGRKDKTMRQL